MLNKLREKVGSGTPHNKGRKKKSEVFGNVSFHKSEAFSCVQFWGFEERECPLSLEEAEAKLGALEDYKKWALMEEMSWRQNSREVWLRDGDKNTKFFHKMSNARA